MQLSKDLTSHEHRHIADVLHRKKPGIHPIIICHKLPICPQAKPVSQKKMKIREERRKAVREEVDKLLNVNFIREVKYFTWLANVIVKKEKKNGECAVIILI